MFLVWDARRLGDEQLVGYFRRRAIGAAIVAGAVAIAGIFILRADVPTLFDDLVSDSVPLVLLSAACGVAALVLLQRGADRGARLLAMAAVGSIVVGWGVAQWPYLLPDSLTVSEAAAPSSTLAALLVAAGCFVLLIVPGFLVLYVLDQRSLLPAEGVD